MFLLNLKIPDHAYKKLNQAFKTNRRHKKPIQIGQKAIFRTPWFSLQELKFKTKNLNISPYYRLKTKGGVLIIAITKRKKVILVKQFRPAIGSWTYETPAGAIEKNQTPLNAAKRELFEETGYISKQWKNLSEGRLMMDRFSGKIHGWFAVNCFKRGSSKKNNHLPLMLISPNKLFKLFIKRQYYQVDALGFLALAILKFPNFFNEKNEI